MTKVDRYPVRIFWDDEEDAFLALAPDLPGCSAYGATEQEALTSIREAIEGWIDATRAVGNVVPDPSPAPHAPNYSGKILVRMPQTLHGQLAKAAEQEGTSLNQYIVFLLTEGHTRQSFQAAYRSNAASCLNFYAWSTIQFGQVRPLSGITVMTSAGSSDFREFDRSMAPQIRGDMTPSLLGKGTDVVLSTTYQLQK